MLKSKLLQIFSDKKNLVRFAMATLALIITAQLMPGIIIASFWMALLLVILMISIIILSRPTFAYFKLPFRLEYYGLFIWVSYSIVILLLDWIPGPFEIKTIWWGLLYCLIQAVFNCIIENLMQEE